MISPLRAVTVETIDDILSLPTDNRQTGLASLVNKYYDLGADTDYQGTYATKVEVPSPCIVKTNFPQLPDWYPPYMY